MKKLDKNTNGDNAILIKVEVRRIQENEHLKL
jgi:hypothetical protein